MRQIFLLFLLIVLGQWFVKALRRAQMRSGSQGQQAQQGQNTQGGRGAQGAWRASNGAGAAGRSNGQGALPEPMVCCAECGVHAPRSESVTAGAQSFCCAEHARAYVARSADKDRAAR
ncbi:PP0621 family protein [Paraburkholderia dinghuensis]|uniref:Deaminase n=1 Tax=Paraburkholderia dinghuensis TaxID=2305225 RepID=A0A3N6MIR1_9BURK|nr:PP0621 family protein [Paraburkholderia dinghuensis]RQH01075.1 deaminase [Paraburkholderia dinghuensis]